MIRGRGEATTVDRQKQEGSVLLYTRHERASGPGFNHNLNFNQYYCSIVRECDMPLILFCRLRESSRDGGSSVDRVDPGAKSFKCVVTLPARAST